MDPRQLTEVSATHGKDKTGKGLYFTIERLRSRRIALFSLSLRAEEGSRVLSGAERARASYVAP